MLFVALTILTAFEREGKEEREKGEKTVYYLNLSGNL